MWWVLPNILVRYIHIQNSSYIFTTTTSSLDLFVNDLKYKFLNARHSFIILPILLKLQNEKRNPKVGSVVKICGEWQKICCSTHFQIINGTYTIMATNILCKSINKTNTMKWPQQFQKHKRCATLNI